MKVAADRLFQLAISSMRRHHAMTCHSLEALSSIHWITGFCCCHCFTAQIAQDDSAENLGDLMRIGLADVVKPTIGVQGALQGAGTSNQAGIVGFVPPSVGENSVCSLMPWSTLTLLIVMAIASSSIILRLVRPSAPQCAGVIAG